LRDSVVEEDLGVVGADVGKNLGSDEVDGVEDGD
jgi:hypothetical protein